MVTTEACIGGASGRYASYRNAFLFDVVFPTGCLLQIFSPVVRPLETHQSSVDAVFYLFAGCLFNFFRWLLISDFLASCLFRISHWLLPAAMKLWPR